MPYAPVLGRAETQQRAPADPARTPDRHGLIDAVTACQQQLSDLLGRLDPSTPGAPASNEAESAPLSQDVAPVRQAVEATLQRLDEASAREHDGGQLTEFEERVWRRLVETMRAETRRIEAAVRAEVEAVRGDVERLDAEHTRAEATAMGRLANQLVALEERVSKELVDNVRADARQVESVVEAQVAALRGDVEAVRRAQVEREADLRGTLEHQDAVRGSELAGFGQTIARFDADLTTFEERVSQRLIDAVRADGRRGEAAIGAELAVLRSGVDDLRHQQAGLDADLRSTLEHQDAARASEVAGLGDAITRLETELARSMAAIDGRIVHHVRRARIAVDEEMATLRQWVESVVTKSTGGAWAVLARAVRDPLGALASVVSLLIEA